MVVTDPDEASVANVGGAGAPAYAGAGLEYTLVFTSDWLRFQSRAINERRGLGAGSGPRTGLSEIGCAVTYEGSTDAVHIRLNSGRLGWSATAVRSVLGVLGRPGFWANADPGLDVEISGGSGLAAAELWAIGICFDGSGGKTQRFGAQTAAGWHWGAGAHCELGAYCGLARQAPFLWKHFVRKQGFWKHFVRKQGFWNRPERQQGFWNIVFKKHGFFTCPHFEHSPQPDDCPDAR